MWTLVLLSDIIGAVDFNFFELRIKTHSILIYVHKPVYN